MKITVIFVVAFLLVSCSPGFPIGAGDLNAVTPDGNSSPTQSPIIAPTTVPATVTSTPAQQFPLPSYDSITLHQLVRDITFPLTITMLGDWGYRCQIISTESVIVNLNDRYKIGGILYCAGVDGVKRIPASIYDGQVNKTYVWSGGIISSPTEGMMDKVGLIHLMSMVDPQARIPLEGQIVSMEVGFTNQSNRGVVDVQNFGPTIEAYYGTEAVLEEWATTGVWPDEYDWFFPNSLGFIKDP